MKTAIVVPGVTDLNKGDQALVWESHRLIKDTGQFDKIFILSNGDTPEERKMLCGQSEQRGFKLIENILKHPRRGVHKNKESIKESKASLVLQGVNALKDLASRSFLIKICNNLGLVKLLYDRQTYDTVKQFSEADAVFIKGGGFIHAYGETTAPYLMWFFLFYVKLAKRLNKKVIFLPNSFGPFEGLGVKSQVKSALGDIDLLYAREEISAKAISELLDKSIPVSLDLGFYLKSANDDRSNEVLSKYGLTASDKIVGLTIRPWRFPGKPNPEDLYSNYIESVFEMSKHILSKGYKLVLCNQSIGPNSHEDDRNAIQELLKRLSGLNVIWINENLACDDLKSLYSKFYFFIGTRFHSVIFSLTSLVPSIAIGYGGNKAKGIMSDFNFDKYVIQIDEVNKQDLISMFDDAIDNYDIIKSKLKEHSFTIEERRNNIISDIIKVVS